MIVLNYFLLHMAKDHGHLHDLSVSYTLLARCPEANLIIYILTIIRVIYKLPLFLKYMISLTFTMVLHLIKKI